jgi:flagellar hook-associated protein 3 FlgL
MNVTNASLYASLAAEINNSSSTVSTLTEQLSSGKKVQQFSDSPSDAVAIMQIADQQNASTAYGRSASDAQRWLGAADASIGGMTDLLSRVRDLAISAVSGAADSTSRAASAAEVSQLRDQLVSAANGDTGIPGQSLYGGFSSTAVSQVGGVWTFTGDTGSIQRQVGSGVQIQVNTNGSALFGFSGTPGTDVFSTLDKLATDMTSGDTAAITADETALQAHASRISQAHGDVGSTMDRLTSATTIQASKDTLLATQRSNSEDIDTPQVTLLLAQAQNGYQAALAVAAKTTSMPSLIDFLR